MKTKIFFTSLFALLMSVTSFAQRGDYSKEPGYVDFGSFESLDKSEAVTEVIIEEKLLRMVSKMAKNEDEELSDLIGGLKLIRVHSFEVTETNISSVKSRIKRIDKDLMDQNWDRIVRVKSPEESANIYIKTVGDDKIAGLVVAAIDEDDQATFVNIIGDINLETIGKLSDKFDIPNLKDINGGSKKDENIKKIK